VVEVAVVDEWDDYEMNMKYDEINATKKNRETFSSFIPGCVRTNHAEHWEELHRFAWIPWSTLDRWDWIFTSCMACPFLESISVQFECN